MLTVFSQVHFYFSDSNLPNDKFLFKLTGGVENKPVELKLLHSFKRMKHFQPFEAIVAALRSSDQVELTDDETCVRRKVPLPDNYFKVDHTEANMRSVYLKGFGEEGPRTQFDIEAFFDPYGPTRAVRLRRNDEKHFKGSVFVEFDTEELAKAFLALDPKPQYEGKDLQVMSKIEYMEKKSDDLKTGRMTSNGKNYNSQRGGKYNNRDRDHRPRRNSPDYSKGGRGKQDDRDWRTRRDEDQKKGFRDDKQREGRGSKGYGGGRSKAPDMDERLVGSTCPEVVKANKGYRGIPTVKSTANDRDSGRSEALAKARAAVEADQKQEQEDQKAADDSEAIKQENEADASNHTANVEAIASKKRARGDDDGDEERDIKKVDTKDEVSTGTAES
jgi:hypothetical protein